MDTALNITPLKPWRPLAVKAGQTQQNQIGIEDKKLREKCNEFESVLFNCMLKAMRKTVPKSELFYGGIAEDIYSSMLDQEYARIISNNSANGMAEVLYNQLSSEKPGSDAPPVYLTGGIPVIKRD